MHDGSRRTRALASRLPRPGGLPLPVPVRDSFPLALASPTKREHGAYIAGNRHIEGQRISIRTLSQSQLDRFLSFGLV